MCPALLEIASTNYTSLLTTRFPFQIPHTSVSEEVTSNPACASFTVSTLIKHKQLSA